ncbi:acyltransferase family protein [Sphingosinicella soli]|uniref:Fucose 4-O-acetylase-like acetyltransferase n=1 Tax=Sphingosinicella soli TaxID=333708 RepID=A0A7W7B3V4_9SPHN|nr:acyltransferase [Sphingosinicella soli]MBB4633481.1 fucose 4-O-acetylase-like acetyltransferase [Sphingosinicella soli]
MQQPVRNAEPVSARLSDTISVVRVVCVLGIVYVHAWTGLSGEQLAALAQSGQGLLRLVLMEVFGRSAVPLLGLISGYLVAGAAIRSWRGFLARKARTILLPMALWNALAILLVSGTAWLGFVKAPVPESLWWLIDELFSILTPNHINVQAPFLRDLFVCMALAPLLLRLRGPWLTGVILLAAAWSLSGWTIPLMLRPPILLFFLLGIGARRHHLGARIAEVPLAAALAPFVAVAAIKLIVSVPVPGGVVISPVFLPLLDLGLRLAAALAFARIAWGLAARPAMFRRLEPYAFFLFCSHMILIWLATPLFEALTGPLGSPAYPFLLIVHPLIALGFALGLGQVLVLFAPRAAEILSGGRLKADAADMAEMRAAS